MNHCYRSLTFVASILFGPLNDVQAATIYIKPDGTGDQPTIQAGVIVAAPGDTILLAAGTFVGTGNKDVVFGKDLIVTSESGAAVTIIDCEGSGRGFTYALGETAASVLREITIRNGNPGGFGGAVLCINTSPSFIECVFESNTALGSGGGGGGGGAYCQGGSPTFQDCSFNDNENPGADGVGGGISLLDCVHAQILGCSFEENSAAFSPSSAGAAVFDWFSSRVTLSGCEFRKNISRVGGAVALLGTEQAEIATNTFEENSAESGGALAGFVDGLTVTDCQFLRNTADAGAATEISSFPVEFERCFFQDNVATVWGGAVADGGGPSQFTECIFSRNSAPIGGAILLSGVTSSVQNCTFHANSAEQGSVFATSVGGTASVSNSILAFNVGEVATCFSGGVDLDCCDVYGTVGGDYVGCIAPEGGVDGNFSADPLFCAKEENNFTIEAFSPCAPPGVTNCGLVGALPVGCEPVSVVPASWGEIKARYRSGGTR
jgi:hypothetical protein